MKTIDLVVHDWLNLRPGERELALRDLEALADDITAKGETHLPEDAVTPIDPQRRARTINMVRSFMLFFSRDVLGIPLGKAPGGKDESSDG